MPAPKEVMTARVSANTKKKLAEKADQIFVGLSSYVSTVLDDHAELLMQEHYDQSYAPSEHSNIISFFQKKASSEKQSDKKKISIVESAPLHLIFSHEIKDSVLVPIQPITSLVNRRLFAHPETKEFRGYIYYDSIDYLWIREHQSQNSNPFKIEGFTSFTDAFKRFESSKDKVIICGPLVSAYLTNSTSFVEIQLSGLKPIEIPLTTYLKVPFGEHLLETDIKQARSQWEYASTQFISMLNEIRDKKSHKLKQYCDHTLPDLSKTLGYMTESVCSTFVESTRSLDMIFPNNADVRAYFGDKSELDKAMSQWVRYTL